MQHDLTSVKLVMQHYLPVPRKPLNTVMGMAALLPLFSEVEENRTPWYRDCTFDVDVNILLFNVVGIDSSRHRCNCRLMDANPFVRCTRFSNITRVTLGIANDDDGIMNRMEVEDETMDVDV